MKESYSVQQKANDIQEVLPQGFLSFVPKWDLIYKPAYVIWFKSKTMGNTGVGGGGRWVGWGGIGC